MVNYKKNIEAFNEVFLVPARLYLWYVIKYFFSIDMTDERKDLIVSQLNAEFNKYLEDNMTINDAYVAMVKKSPYKILNNFSYDWSETPLNDNLETPRANTVEVRKNIYILYFHKNISFFIFYSVHVMKTKIIYYIFIKIFHFFFYSTPQMVSQRIAGHLLFRNLGRRRKAF